MDSSRSGGPILLTSFFRRKIEPFYFLIGFIGAAAFFWHHWTPKEARLYLRSVAASESIPIPVRERVYQPKIGEFKSWALRPRLARYVRALREREMDGIVFWIFPGESLAAQSLRLEETVKELSERKIYLINSSSPPRRRGSRTWIPVPFPMYQGRYVPTDYWMRDTSAGMTELSTRRFLACLLAILLPFLLWRRRDSWSPAGIFAAALAGGALVRLILSVDAFTLQRQPLGFVQLAFLAPFAAVVWSRRKDWPAFSLVLTATLLILSGLRLKEVLPVPEAEHALRDWLDVEAGLRPRFKEIAGWFFWSLPGSFWSLPALLGPVGTLNSFMHAHSAFPLVLARSCAGFLMGALFARLIAWFLRPGPHAGGLGPLERRRRVGPRAALAGYFGRGNFGDDWLLESEVRQLRRQEGLRDGEIDLWPRGFPNAMRGRPERVIFLGGLLQSATSFRSFAWYLASACFASFWARNEIVFSSCSIGPLSRRARFFLRFLLHSPLGRKIRFEVRDDASADLLCLAAPRARWNFKMDETVRAPVFAGVKEKKNFSLPRLGIAVNAGEMTPEACDWVRRLRESFRKRAEFILLLPHPGRDAAVFNHLEGFSFFQYQGNTEAFIRELRKMDALISWRLHPAIAALQEKIPVLFPAWLSRRALDKIPTLCLPAALAPLLACARKETEAFRWMETKYGKVPQGMVSLS